MVTAEFEEKSSIIRMLNSMGRFMGPGNGQLLQTPLMTVGRDKLLVISLSKAILTYENLVIMSNFNIDMESKSLGYDKLDEFCDLFNLTNMIKSETCFAKYHKSPIDLFLTNTPLSFQKTHVSETS